MEALCPGLTLHFLSIQCPSSKYVLKGKVCRETFVSAQRSSIDSHRTGQFDIARKQEVIAKPEAFLASSTSICGEKIVGSFDLASKAIRGLFMG